MIQVGSSVYYENAPWLLTTQGTVTPTAYVLPPALVPPEAVRYYLQTIVLRGWADQVGNIDVAAVLRLPGFTETNYALAGAIAETGRPVGAATEVGGSVIPVPNIDNTFYWLIQGNTLAAGADVTIALLGYDLPATGACSCAGRPVTIALTGVIQ